MTDAGLNLTPAGPRTPAPAPASAAADDDDGAAQEQPRAPARPHLPDDVDQFLTRVAAAECFRHAMLLAAAPSRPTSSMKEPRVELNTRVRVPQSHVAETQIPARPPAAPAGWDAPTAGPAFGPEQVEAGPAGQPVRQDRFRQQGQQSGHQQEPPDRLLLLDIGRSQLRLFERDAAGRDEPTAAGRRRPGTRPAASAARSDSAGSSSRRPRNGRRRPPRQTHGVEALLGQPHRRHAAFPERDLLAVRATRRRRGRRGPRRHRPAGLPGAHERGHRGTEMSSIRPTVCHGVGASNCARYCASRCMSGRYIPCFGTSFQLPSMVEVNAITRPLPTRRSTSAAAPSSNRASTWSVAAGVSVRYLRNRMLAKLPLRGSLNSSKIGWL